LVVPDRLFTEPLVPICGLPRRVRQLVQSDRGAPIAGPLIPLDQKAPSATVLKRAVIAHRVLNRLIIQPHRSGAMISEDS
jgi:hypothetical protein